MSAIIQKTQDTAWDTWNKWSTAKLVQVPENLANSDHPGKKRPAQCVNGLSHACLFLFSHCMHLPIICPTVD